MRLKKLHIITEYKNLKDFKLAFDGQSFIDIFVGKNGTGKSNLFEAIIEIFRHLNEFDKNSFEISFDYSIQYEIEGEDTEIKWEGDKLGINGKERKSVGNTPLPDNVLIYYSGHNTKVSALVEEYENSFKKTIKKADVQDTRKFIGVGKDYKQLLLSILLIQDSTSKSKQFVGNKLGIKSIANLLRIVLKRPFYARSDTYDVINNDESDRFWKAEGITKDFLNRLTRCLADNSKAPIRTEGYFNKDHSDYSDRYILHFDVTALQKEFKEISPQELFRQFDNLKTLDMLEEISIKITLENDIEANTDYFSDGQFQSVYIFSIIELFKDRNCITLLDEPDSFLHPEWQFEFLKQVFEITDSDSAKNYVLMCSHSAASIASAGDKHLSLFAIENGNVVVSEVPKREAIRLLSKGFINLSEDETLMSIATYLKNTTEPVLFTEGISDEYILEAAWKKLFPDDRKGFCIHHAFDRSFLRNLFMHGELKTNHPGRIFFALFDFDDAYDDWKQLGQEEIVKNPYNGLVRKNHKHSLFACLLPVPNVDAIKNQVLQPETDIPWKSGRDCHLTIELLFYGLDGLDEHFDIIPQSCGGEKVVFKGDKVFFAEQVVPDLDAAHFEIFRPLFEFVKSVI